MAAPDHPNQVLAALEPLKREFDVVQYGALEYVDAARYPLFAIKTRGWDARKPCVLVTGGVHGYEKSGVQGALLFARTAARAYSEARPSFACRVCRLFDACESSSSVAWCGRRLFDARMPFGPRSVSLVRTHSLWSSVGLSCSNALSLVVGRSLLFERTLSLSQAFNILIAPCVSPWGYESIAMGHSYSYTSL